MSVVATADSALAALAVMDVPAYDADKIPADPAFPYVVVYLDIGRGDNYRLSARTTTRTWRLAVMIVGSSTYEARYACDQVDAALAGTRIAIPGFVTTPLRNESSQPVEREDPDVPGIYTTTSVWRFATTPAVD